MTEQASSIPATILAELSVLVRPVSFLESPEGVIALLRELGWDPPSFTGSFPDLLTKLTTVDERLGDLLAADSDQALVSAASGLLAAIGDLLQALARLPGQLHDALTAFADFRDNSGIATELHIRLINYLVARYAVGHRPTVANVLTVLGVLEWV
jgi:hypothetical protein